MSEREKLKEFIKTKYPNGYSPTYTCPLYLFYDEKKGFTSEELTSGIMNARFAFHRKFYQSWEEMYEDVKLYFNPNE